MSSNRASTMSDTNHQAVANENGQAAKTLPVRAHEMATGHDTTDNTTHDITLAATDTNAEQTAAAQQPFRFQDLPPTVQGKILRLLLVTPTIRVPIGRPDYFKLLDEQLRLLGKPRPKPTVDERFNICKTCWKYQIWGFRIFWAENVFEIDVSCHDLDLIAPWLTFHIRGYSGMAWNENWEEELAHYKPGHVPRECFQASRSAFIRKLKFTTKYPESLRLYDVQKSLTEQIAMQFEILQLFYALRYHKKRHDQDPLTSLDYLEFDFRGLDPRGQRLHRDRRVAEQRLNGRIGGISEGIGAICSCQSDGHANCQGHRVSTLKVLGCPVGEPGGELAEILQSLSIRSSGFFHDDGTQLRLTPEAAEDEQPVNSSSKQMLPLGFDELLPVRIQMMDFPVEIKERILNELLIFSKQVYPHSLAIDINSPTNYAILQTCSELYNLGVEILYRRNSFYVVSLSEHMRWLHQTVSRFRHHKTRTRLSMIHNLTFDDTLDIVQVNPAYHPAPLYARIRSLITTNPAMTALIIKFDDLSYDAAQNTIQYLKKTWGDKRMSSRYQRVVVDLSYTYNGGVIDDLEGMWEIQIPHDLRSPQVPLKSITFKGRESMEDSDNEDEDEDEDEDERIFTFTTLDRILRNSFTSSENGSLHVCRKAPSLPKLPPEVLDDADDTELLLKREMEERLTCDELKAHSIFCDEGSPSSYKFHPFQLRQEMVRPVPWCNKADRSPWCVCKIDASKRDTHLFFKKHMPEYYYEKSPSDTAWNRHMGFVESDDDAEGETVED